MDRENFKKAIDEACDALEHKTRENAYLRRMVGQLIEMIDRQGNFSVSEKYLLEAADQYAERLPIG